MTVVERAGTSNESGRVPLLVIIASVREARFGPVVGHWFARRAREHNRVAVDTVDLAATPIPASLARDATVDAFAARVGAAEAVVVVTPEYNHGYPGALKNALDAVREEWAAKPVAFVSYGGLAGGLRSVELLRLVAAELHMVSIRETVSFHSCHQRFDADGNPKDPAADAAADLLLNQLCWWAEALRAARATVPYPAR